MINRFLVLLEIVSVFIDVPKEDVSGFIGISFESIDSEERNNLFACCYGQFRVST